MPAQHPPRRRLLIPRPAPQGEAFAARLEAAAPGMWDAVLAPVMEIRPTGAEPRTDDIDGLILTSANAVDAFRAAVPRGSWPAACVGPATTAAARSAGLDAWQAGADAEALIAALVRRGPGTRWLHLRGRHAARDVAGALADAGISCDEAVLYDQACVPLPPAIREALLAGEFGAVALFSPRMAVALGDALGAALPDTTVRVAISTAVAQAAAPLGPGPIAVAREPNGAEMIECLIRVRSR